MACPGYEFILSGLLETYAILSLVFLRSDITWSTGTHCVALNKWAQFFEMA